MKNTLFLIFLVTFFSCKEEINQENRINEDVAFLGSNWGIKLVKLLQKKGSGLCGLAGSTRQFNLPIGYETGLKKYRHINYM